MTFYSMFNVILVINAYFCLLHDSIKQFGSTQYKILSYDKTFLFLNLSYSQYISSLSFKNCLWYRNFGRELKNYFSYLS